MISILCSFAPDMQSFLMPPNYFDDGYLAIFLRQLSRRGLLLFYCSQKLTELDTPISFPLSFVPPLYTQKMLQEKIASEKIIIALSYFCQTRYQENWRLSEVFLSLLLLLGFLNTPSNCSMYTKNRSFIFDGISPGLFESTSTEKKRVLYRVFTTGLGMLLLCMQSRIHAQRVQVRALLHTLPKICWYNNPSSIWCKL